MKGGHYKPHSPLALRPYLHKSGKNSCIRAIDQRLLLHRMSL